MGKQMDGWIIDENPYKMMDVWMGGWIERRINNK